MLKLKFKDPQIKPVDLTNTRLTIGRDKTNDLVLSDSNISGFHAEIQTEDGRSFLVDLGSSNGTFVGGKKITGRQELKAWDVVRFGPVEAEIVDSEKRRPTTVMKAVGDATTVSAAVGNWALAGTSNPVAGKVFPVTGKMVLGRDPKCDIVVEASGVSAQHAELEIKGESLYIRDLSSTNGTYVAGKKVTESILNNGDEVRLDEVRFKVQGPESDISKTKVRPAVGVDKTQVNKAVGATQVMASADQTRLLGKGAFSGKTFSVKGTVMTVGRTAENDISINEDTVSSKHARLVAAGGGWKLEDLGSSNGTTVNGKKIENQQLGHGDTICFGKAEFLFENQTEQSSTTGTKVMGSIDGATVTSVTPSAGKSVPAWLWGVGGFGLVALGFIVFLVVGRNGGAPILSGGNSKIVEAKVQGGTVWQQQLADGRKGPSTPVLADVNGDGMLDVVIGDAKGYLTALDGEKGLKIFTSMAPDKILAPPVAVKLAEGKGVDIVAATNGGQVKAYNGEGNVLWTSPGDLNMGEILNRPVYRDVNDDKIEDIIVPTAKKGLVALDGGRGWEIWNTGEIFQGKIINAPVKADINDDNLADYVGVTESGHVAAVTSEKGKVWKLWEAQVPGTFYGSPVFLKAGKQGLVVIPTNKEGIVAIDGMTGRTVWTVNLPKQFFASPVATDANGDKVEDVVLLAMNGDIHVLDGRTGDEIWSLALGTQIQASPALFEVNGDGLKDLIVLDGNSNVHVIDMNRGRILLTLNVEGAGGFVASPVLGDVNGDGLLDVVTAGQSGNISALFLNRPVKKGVRVWPEFLGGI